jgi:hypothetical protein
VLIAHSGNMGLMEKANYKLWKLKFSGESYEEQWASIKKSNMLNETDTKICII